MSAQSKYLLSTLFFLSGLCWVTPLSAQETVTDIDGNVYKTVKIGTQTWMAENLKTTKYRNGDPIPNVADSAAWETLTSGAYCDYNNDPSNATTYGRLYNWYAVNTGNLAPTGWHVATDAEWKILADYLGGEKVAGGKLKEAGTTHWNSPNPGANNSSGLTALPGGYRMSSSRFLHVGVYGCWWSSTEIIASNAWFWLLRYDRSDVSRNLDRNVTGFAVRCVKD